MPPATSGWHGEAGSAVIVGETTTPFNENGHLFGGVVRHPW